MKDAEQIRTLHSRFKDLEISGRYITNNHLNSFLESQKKYSITSVFGYSVLGKPIYMFTVGTGKLKLLIWSQMHGNESTTTKATADFVNFLTSDDLLAQSFREKFTYKIILILNPDGAELYTRENANKVDLNRDFLNLSQPESRMLMDLYNDFCPDFCFNMHDQRTIFSVGNTAKSATISFLAPSFNENRDLNAVRTRAINVIVDCNNILQEYIPGYVGRFDDSYNRNCAGDTFQNLGTSTVLFEAGHYPGDYQREVSREAVFVSLVAACESISDKPVLDNRIEIYVKIPQNKTLFYDFVYKNVKINYDGNEIRSIFAAQYREVLQEDSIVLIAYISEVNVSGSICGHVEYNCNFELFRDEVGNIPVIGQIANFQIGDKFFKNGQLLE